jgi:hypothetical protein
MAREQSNNTELKVVDTLFNFASTDRGRHALLRSRQVPTEDKSSQAQTANFDRAEAG